MSHQSTSLAARPEAMPARLPSSVPAAGPAWIGNTLLTLATVTLMALACASGWLSYHAQVDYVLDHNGGRSAQARVWALLLDAGTAGVSLLRLYETLRGRRGSTTRASLLGCVAASVTMNLLHAASHTPGGYLVAAVPPVMYAVFLEHLLTNVRCLLIGEEKQHKLWRALLLWINFPAVMWSVRRSSLRREAEGHRFALDPAVRNGVAPDPPPTSEAGEAELEQEVVHANEAGRDSPRRSRKKGRRLGAKRLAFEAALAEQARSGDLRLFSTDERERNAAAYQAAASLPAPLSRGAARRYVVQALARLDESGPVSDDVSVEAQPALVERRL